LWPLTINDRGEIAGSGFDINGDIRDFLLIPCGPGEGGCGDNATSTTATLAATSTSHAKAGEKSRTFNRILGSRLGLSRIPGFGRSK
jgi:hypothetical protein